MAKGNGGGNAQGITVGRISIKVSPDTKKFRSELQNELNDIERTLKGDLEVNAHLDSAQMKADFRRMMSQLQAQASKGIVVPAHVAEGQAKGGKGGNTVVAAGEEKKTGGGLLGGFSKMADFPSFGSGINPAGWLTILAGVVALAAPLLGLITTTLLAIPGLIGLITAPIAAITLGLDGFKKAAERIKEPFEALKTKMSEVTETAFSPVMDRIASEIFPKLQASLPKVTEGLAQMAQGVVDGLSGPQMQNAITNIGNAFTNMRPGIEGFTSGFTGLIDQFSLKLPAITDWFNDVGTRFDAWVAKISADGSLGRAFDGLGTTIDAILASMGKLALSGLEWIQDPQKVADFVDGLKDLLGVLEDIAALSSTLKDLFKNVLPSFNWDGIKKDLVDPFTSDDAPWRKILDNGGHMLPNMGEGDVGGAKAQVDGVTNSLKEVPTAAQEAKAALDLFNSGASTPGAFNTDPFAQQPSVPVAPAVAAPEAPNKIPPPETEEAKAKLAEYNTFVETVTAQVKTAMQGAAGEGGAVPPPNFDAFKQAWNELPNTVTTATDAVKTAMSGVTESVTTEGVNAAAAAQTAADGIKAPLEALAGQMGQVGADICIGLATGIANNSSVAINAAIKLATDTLAAAKGALDSNSPSKKFIQLGEDVGAGMGIGLENGFKPVLDQASDLSKKISDAFMVGSDPTGFLNGFTDKEASRMEKVLSYQQKLLGYRAEELELAGRIAEADAARAEQKQLGRQKASLDLAQDFAELQKPEGESDWKGPIAQIMNGMAQMPTDFMTANANQAMQDLGISGGGLMGAITDYGQELGSKFIFNVGNMEDALTAQQNLTNRQAMGVVGR